MTAIKIAHEYARAWLGGDVEKAMSFVADDVVGRAPGGEIRGRDAFRQLLEPFATALIGSELIDVVGDDHHAAAVYAVETPFAKVFHGMEYLTVEDGRITQAIIIFDRLPAFQARAAKQG
jgi:ketosteroid isomerase-like protein